MTSVPTSLTLTADPSRAVTQAKDEQKLRAARAALQTYDKQRTEAADERKAIARKKAEDLKARIQMMKLSMPSDPKAAARVIAALARELGATVKAYGGAGGGLDAGLTLVASETVTPETTAAASDPGEDGADAVESEAAGTPTDPYRQAIDAQEKRGAEMARRSESARADSEFATTVRGLMAELKAMALKARKDAREAGDAPPEELTAVDRTLDGITGDLGAAGGALSGAMMSLTV